MKFEGGKAVNIVLFLMVVIVTAFVGAGLGAFLACELYLHKRHRRK